MRYAQAFQDHRAAGFAFKGQSFAGVTGTMAAALADQACVFALRYPEAGLGKFLVDWMHLHYVCIGAFTAPVSAGRRLHLKRGSGGSPTTGTDLDIVRDQSSLTTAHEAVCAGQISATAALTMTDVVFETPVRARLLLAQAGASGQSYDEIWTFDDPVVLIPGQLIGLLAGQAFDAAGTWQLSVKGHGKELV